jgi:hypothetical protein
VVTLAAGRGPGVAAHAPSAFGAGGAVVADRAVAAEAEAAGAAAGDAADEVDGCERSGPQPVTVTSATTAVAAAMAEVKPRNLFIAFSVVRINCRSRAD